MSPPLALRPGLDRHPVREVAPRRPRRARCTAASLREALLERAERTPEEVAFYFFDLAEQLSPLSCGELLARAARVAEGLRERGLVPGDRVLLCFDTGPDLLAAFFGCVLAGTIPALVEPPTGLGRNRSWSDALAERREILGARALLIDGALAPRALADCELPGLAIVRPEDLSASPDALPAGALDPAAPAFLQFTSGTTSRPRAVEVHTGPLFHNARGIAAASSWSEDELIVTWLPLHHDMGLVGLTLAPFLHGLPVAFLPPLAFILRPSRWLWALHHFRGTVSGGPNFAYHLCATRTSSEEVAGLDLGSWRLAYNGAEMVQPETLRRFQERFGPHGFRPRSMVPVYGLAEMVVAATFPVRGPRPRLDTIDREILAAEGRAVPAAAGSPRALTLVAVGPPLADHELQVVGPDGTPLPERREGRLRLRGPSVTAGYFAAPEDTAAVFRDGWLETGDLGYVAEGELFVCGREKDLIVKAGGKHHPHAFEAAAAGVPGVRAGAVAAFGLADEETGTEEVGIVFETELAGEEARRQLCRRVAAAVFDQVGIHPARVVPVAPRTLPKTSSGKLARASIRQQYQAGAYDPPRGLT